MTYDPPEEESRAVVVRWSALWAEVADEAERLIGRKELTMEGALIIAALLTIAERLER